MPRKIQLTVGHLTGESEVHESKKYLDKPVMMVYAGKFDSMDGEVEIKDEDIKKLVENHNSFLSKLSRLATGEVPIHHNPPLQLDHSTSAHDTIGRLVGPLSEGEHIDEDGGKHLALMGKVRVLGAENMEKVADGRWSHVSIGADLETHKLSELSITPFPAAANASLLSRNKKTNLSAEEEHLGYKDLKEKMSAYEKCRKHLTEHKKMSEEDAEKHLEKATDDELTAMSKEADDHLKHLAEEEDKKKKELAEKEESDKKTEMAAKKTKVVELSKGIKTSLTKIQLGAKATVVHQKVTRLRAAAKITPAEIKLMKIDELAGKSDEAIEAALSSYEKREVVVDTGLYGSRNGLSAAKLAGQLKKMNMERDELQTRLNMPMKREEALKRLSELEQEEKAVQVQVDNSPQDELKGFDEAYEMHRKLSAEGKHDEAKEHLKSYMKALSGQPELHAPNVEPPTAAMSALAGESKAVHDKFVELMKLTAPAFGANVEEL